MDTAVECTMGRRNLRVFVGVFVLVTLFGCAPLGHPQTGAPAPSTREVRAAATTDVLGGSSATVPPSASPPGPSLASIPAPTPSLASAPTRSVTDSQPGPAPSTLNDQMGTPYPTEVGTAGPLSPPTLKASEVLGTRVPGQGIHKIYYFAGEAARVDPGPRRGTDVWTLDPSLGKTEPVYEGLERTFELSGLELSQDGTQLAFVAWERERGQPGYPLRSFLAVTEASAKSMRRLVESGPRVAPAYPQWSPDGTRLLYTLLDYTEGGYPPQTETHLVDVASGKDEILPELGGQCSWSPDGSKLACSLWPNESGLLIYDLATQQKKSLWADAGLEFSRPAWQPGGSQLTVSVTDAKSIPSVNPAAGLYAVDINTAKRSKLVDGDTSAASWSPDGRRIAYLLGGPVGVDRNTIPYLYDLETMASTRLLDNAAFLGAQPWSPDGKLLLMAVEEKRDSRYWISLLDLSSHTLNRVLLINAFMPELDW